MDFYDILLKRKTGKPCKNFYDDIFASDGGGGKPALVPWSTGTDEEIVVNDDLSSGAVNVDKKFGIAPAFCL